MKTDTSSRLPKSNRRRSFIRLGIMLAAAALLWWGYEETSTLHPLIHVSRQTVLEKYTAQDAAEAAQGRTLKEIAFHNTFSGDEGSTFYVVWETADGAQETEKYRIVSGETPPGYQFAYQTMFTNMPLPSSQFDVFSQENGNWKEQDS